MRDGRLSTKKTLIYRNLLMFRNFDLFIAARWILHLDGGNLSRTLVIHLD
jgi:hypothetical protein